MRQRRRALLELLVIDAERRRDLLTGLDLVEELIAADPDEEQNYLSGARLLIGLGQVGRARGYLKRADEALTQLELARSGDHDDLRLVAGLG